MRSVITAGVLLLAAACGGGEQPATDTAATAAPPAAPTSISLADVAGRWNVEAKGETSDSVLVRYVMNATADTTGWTITFPDRPPVPVRIVAVEGDSIRIAAGPYQSVLRPGTNVTTAGALRLRDGKLVGMTLATYSGGGADSTLRVRVEGTRAP
jgi:hypothetical protein